MVGKKIVYAFTPQYNRRCAAGLDEQIDRVQPDLVLGLFEAAPLLADVSSPLPLFMYRDMTPLDSMRMGWYRGTTNRPRRNMRQASQLVRNAVSRCAGIAVASDWARQSLVHNYGADAARVVLAPMAANIEPEYVPSRQAVLDRRQGNCCRMIFVGVDWQRKGGDILVEAFDRLGAMGIRAQLTIVGCTPPPEAIVGRDIKVIPFLDKTEPTGCRELAALLIQSDFLVVPTRSEAYGIVYAEGNAFGLPAIGTDVGGVSGVITDGLNGFRLPLSARGDAYAKVIADLWNDPVRLQAMRVSSRDEYERRLNWDVWGETMADFFRGFLPPRLASGIGPSR
ncbi:MAG: glycosyltransferase family 4 protein [Planctomycetaceae bacterium]|nr:glycosyltransferase family 4 protein [Planctomycetaceae bacterium]